MPDGELLGIALMASVPLFIEQLRDTTPDERVILGRDQAHIIAHSGDNILYRSKKRGETATAFNALARGLAIGAYQPGGVTFAGIHFCTDHAACEAAERATDDRPSD